jgi:hypothetical protein
MLTETDPRVTAHINLYAVLGTLPLLMKLVPEARALVTASPLVRERPVDLRIVVPGGPRETISFSTDGIWLGRSAGARTLTLAFVSVNHFNAVIDGKNPPIPVALPWHLGFLTGVFSPLTDLLTRYLRPSDADLADPVFRERSTILTMHVAAAALAQVANEDRSGRVSAKHVPDGAVALEITGTLAYHLAFQNHTATFVGAPATSPRGALTFSTLDVAGGVLAGSLSAIACVSDGRLSMRGHIGMVDNVNRMLDRVGQYLTN